MTATSFAPAALRDLHERAHRNLRDLIAHVGVLTPDELEAMRAAVAAVTAGYLETVTPEGLDLPLE